MPTTCAAAALSATLPFLAVLFAEGLCERSLACQHPGRVVNGTEESGHLQHAPRPGASLISYVITKRRVFLNPWPASPPTRQLNLQFDQLRRRVYFRLGSSPLDEVCAFIHQALNYITAGALSGKRLDAGKVRRQPTQPGWQTITKVALAERFPVPHVSPSSFMTTCATASRDRP